MKGNAQQRLYPCLLHSKTAKPDDLHDTFGAGGPIWIIQYGEFKVSVFINQKKKKKKKLLGFESVTF